MSAIPSPGLPKDAAHLVNRAGFGPRPGQLREVLSQGLPAYVQAQLQADADEVVEGRITRRFWGLGYSVAEMANIYRGTSPAARKDLPVNGITQMLDNLYTAKLFRAVRSQSQLFEVLADFWFNHFNVSRISARQDVIAYERDAIRPHVWGTFRQLLGATATHPAMLFYLDNYLNRKDVVVRGQLVRGINENYGRELLELHTLGVDAGYTQEDVTAAARVLTGWTTDHPRGDLSSGLGGFLFRPEEHDRERKRVFGLEFPAGGGREEGEKLLDYLAAHPATARFISRKLARRFVADDPPQALVDRCAQTFLATHGDLRSVVTTLLDSPEFWTVTPQPRFKTPFEYVVSALRAVDADVQDARATFDRLDAMGMRPFHCPPPTGYSDSGGDWLNPTYLHRLNFGLELAEGRIEGIKVNLVHLAQTFGADIKDPAAIAGAFNRDICGGTLSAPTVEAATVTELGAGLIGRMWNSMTGAPHPLAAGDAAALPARVVGLLLASPDMQRR
jgi:uncharacterized protein (DUF1800 family)